MDAYGSRDCMDEANVPDLLSLPYLNAVNRDDTLYQDTRRWLLSSRNPYFFEGRAARGLGGPHSGMNMIWPLGLIVQGMTSTDENEIRYYLATLQRTQAGTGFMHESSNKDNPDNFTRAWFAWANTMFGEFILKIYTERPALLS